MNILCLFLLVIIDLIVLSFAHDLQIMVLAIGGPVVLSLVAILKILPCRFLFKDKPKNFPIMLLPLLLDIIFGLILVFIIKGAQGDIDGNTIAMHQSTSGAVTKMNLMPNGLINLLAPIAIVSLLLNIITWILVKNQQPKSK